MTEPETGPGPPIRTHALARRPAPSPPCPASTLGCLPIDGYARRGHRVSLRPEGATPPARAPRQRDRASSRGPAPVARWRSRHVRGSGIIQSLGPGTAHVTPFSTTVVLADLAGVLPEWSALELFSARSDREVEAIAYEIALLGQAGIDYSTSDRQYTLRALPARTFSGLQLLALMYVGFKQTHPELTDIGIDLSGPYETALTLFPRKP